MPPHIHSSDEDSGDDVIMPNKTAKMSDEFDGDEASDKGESDNEESNAEGVYTVEAILDHKFDGSELFFLVKWMGYPSKKDWTWEPEDHLAGGSDTLLQEYYRTIGGRPIQPSSVRKRGRQSTGSTAVTPAKSTKKVRTSMSASATGSFHAKSPTEEKETPKESKGPKGSKESKGAKESKADKWKPPAGNWEDAISHIDTIEKTDNGLICYVQWSNGRKSQHDVSVVYKKCPQRMLTFYEQHLVFKESGML